MTVIVAIHDAKRNFFTIGCDQQITDSDDIVSTTNGHKWVNHQNTWIGLSGPTRLLDILRLEIETIVADDDLRGIPDRFRAQLSARGHHLTHNREYPSTSSTSLIVNPDGIWELSSDLALTRKNPFWACGSGQSIALGTMRTLHYDAHVDGTHIAFRAIDNACHYLANCGGEPWVREVQF